MKRLMTFAIAIMIASVAFGQKTTEDYKHPFATKAKQNNTGVTEKFSTEKVNEAQDYKHPHNRKDVERVRLRRGNGESPASSHKHPLG